MSPARKNWTAILRSRGHQALVGACLFATLTLIFVANARADAPACPDAIGLAGLQVKPMQPHSYADADIMKALTPALEAGGMRIPKLSVKKAAAVTAPATPFESSAISGLYAFLVERAKLEAEAYAVDVLNTQLCKTERKPYFARTCEALGVIDSGADVVSGGNMASIQRPLEEDVRYLPACLIKHPPNGKDGSNVGYLIFDSFRQLTSGATLNTADVIYGLATDPHFASECLDPALGNANPSSSYCVMFEAMTAIAAALEVTRITDRNAAKEPEQFVKLFFYDLAAFACTTHQTDEKSTVQACGQYAKTVYDRAVAAMNKPSLDLNDWTDGITHLMLAVRSIAATSEALKTATEALAKEQPKSGDAQEMVVELLATLGEQIGNALAGSAYLPQMTSGPANTPNPDVGAVLNRYAAALHAYALISAHRYVEAVPYAGKVVAPGALPIPKEYVVFVAQMAQAKTSDDMKQALDAVASPIGAWRQKRTIGMWTINSFVGMQGGSETVSGPSVGSSKGGYYGLYVPLGLAYNSPINIDWSPLLSLHGYGGVYLQALDLGVLASDHTAQSQANSGANTGMTRVLSPGISLFVNPSWAGPLTFGIGYVFKTPGLRSTTGPTGQPVNLDSRRLMFTVGIDVTALKLSK